MSLTLRLETDQGHLSKFSANRLLPLKFKIVTNQNDHKPVAFVMHSLTTSII